MHVNRPALFFDLSELFIASSKRLPYYGIARTVREVAAALRDLDAPVRFAVYSPAHRRFFEPSPDLDLTSEFVFPRAVQPRHFRRKSETENGVETSLRAAAGALVNGANRLRWAVSGTAGWTDIDVAEARFVSFARPKLLSAYLHDGAMPAQLFPLLHDLIPLHDLTPSGGPKFARSFQGDTRTVLDHATRVLANSHFTKGEIARFQERGCLGPARPPVSTLQLAHEFTAHPRRADRLTSRPFVLCVGTQPGRKNLDVVLEALRILHGNGDAPNLVLAGAKRKRTAALLASSAFASLSQHVELQINPTHAALADLYTRAQAVIVPSKMEGWGLPLGEALWNATPVIAADVPALREVGGDAASYFDPARAADLAQLIKSHLTADGKAQARARARRAKAQLRRWRDVAQDLLSIVG